MKTTFQLSKRIPSTSPSSLKYMKNLRGLSFAYP